MSKNLSQEEIDVMRRLAREGKTGQVVVRADKLLALIDQLDIVRIQNQVLMRRHDCEGA